MWKVVSGVEITGIFDKIRFAKPVELFVEKFVK